MRARNVGACAPVTLLGLHIVLTTPPPPTHTHTNPGLHQHHHGSLCGNAICQLDPARRQPLPAARGGARGSGESEAVGGRRRGRPDCHPSAHLPPLCQSPPLPLAGACRVDALRTAHARLLNEQRALPAWRPAGLMLSPPPSSFPPPYHPLTVVGTCSSACFQRVANLTARTHERCTRAGEGRGGGGGGGGGRYWEGHAAGWASAGGQQVVERVCRVRVGGGGVVRGKDM